LAMIAIALDEEKQKNISDEEHGYIKFC